MSSWFYQIVDDLCNYDRREEMKELYNRMYNAKVDTIEIRVWCNEMLDIANIPDGSFRTEFMRQLFAGSSDEPRLLLRYIYDIIGDEIKGEEEEDEKQTLYQEEKERIVKEISQIKDHLLEEHIKKLQRENLILEKQKDILFDYVREKDLEEIEEKFNELSDDKEEATCVVCNETKTEDWAWNTTPVKNAPVCSDCLDSK